MEPAESPKTARLRPKRTQSRTMTTRAMRRASVPGHDIQSQWDLSKAHPLNDSSRFGFSQIDCTYDSEDLPGYFRESHSHTPKRRDIAPFVTANNESIGKDTVKKDMEPGQTHFKSSLAVNLKREKATFIDDWHLKTMAALNEESIHRQGQSNTLPSHVRFKTYTHSLHQEQQNLQIIHSPTPNRVGSLNSIVSRTPNNLIKSEDRDSSIEPPSRPDSSTSTRSSDSIGSEASTITLDGHIPLEFRLIDYFQIPDGQDRRTGYGERQRSVSAAMFTDWSKDMEQAMGFQRARIEGNGEWEDGWAFDADTSMTISMTSERPS
jgi:hypothetical protein